MSNNKSLPVIYENVPIKYFKDFKRVEPKEVNSSRLDDYKKCPEFYRIKHVLGYKPKGDAVYLTWGRTVHKFFETLEILYAQKKYPSNESIVGLAIIEAMKEWGDTKDPPPEDRKFGFMTKSRLSDLLIFASKVWLQEKATGNIEVLSAEKSFSIQLPNGMWISGTPDQPLVKWGGAKYVRDFKTTTKEIKYYRRSLQPNDQFIRYVYSTSELVGEKVTGIIVDIFYMTKDKGPTFHREIISFSKEVLDRWVEDQNYWMKVLDYSRENDYYPQNENQCKYCVFHNVCKSQSQMAKEYVLKTEYVFAPWDNIREGAILLGD